MKTKRVDIYYFSSTGNTLLLVREMQRIFESRNLQTRLFDIATTTPEQVDIEDVTIGIAFPVAYFSSFPFVWKFMKNLPYGKGCEVFILNVLRQYSGSLRRQVYEKILYREYIPIAFCEIQMPSSANFQPYNNDQYNEKVKEGILLAEKFALQLADGDNVWKEESIMPKIMEMFKFRKTMWRFLNRDFKLIIDTIKCIRCGICYKICPTGNIEMQDFPEYLDKCQHCFRCVSYCPANAIRFKEKEQFFPHTPLSHEELIPSQ